MALMRVWPKEKNSSKSHADFGGEVAEIFAHHFEREGVIARRHRRVRGEDVGGRDDLQGGVKIELLLRDAAGESARGARKAEWPSFMWKTSGSMPKRVQGVDAANAEHDLLPDPHLEIAAVKLGGDVAGLPRCSPEYRYRAGRV